MSNFTKDKQNSQEDEDDFFKNFIMQKQSNYVNGEEVEIDDGEFDAIVNLYERSTGKELKLIGAPVEGEEVELPYPMPSLDKVKGADARKKLQKFMNENPGPYVVSDKIDGTSLQIIYDEDGNVQILTGGDGINGKDTSTLVEYLDLPELEDCVIRGEMTILNDDFDKLVPILKEKGNKAKNSRNTVNGVVNSKTSKDPVIMEKCKFYAFGVVSENLDIASEFELLEEAGFNVPEPFAIENEEIEEHLKTMKTKSTLKTKKKSDDEVFEEYDDVVVKENSKMMKLENVDALLDILTTTLKERQKNAPYRIDGLVLTSVPNSEVEKTSTDNPEYSVAFKIDTFIAATVTEIEWRATSRYGILTPVAKFEPVDILGVTVKAATCHNAKFVIDHNIGVGAVVTATLGGDIIPKIVSCVLEGEEPEGPDEDVHFNKTEVNIVLDNLDVRPVHLAKLLFFVREIKMKHVGPKVIESLYDKLGVHTIDDFLRLSGERFASLKKGDGDKSTERFLSERRNALESLTFARLMSATCIFGELVGETILDKFIDNFPHWETQNNITAEKIESVKDFGKVRAEQISEGLPVFKEWLSRNPMCYPKIAKLEETEQDLLGHGILFSGIRSDAVENMLKLRGAKIIKSFTSKVTILIVKDANSNTGKPKEARQKGIPIVPIKDVENISSYI